MQSLWEACRLHPKYGISVGVLALALAACAGVPPRSCPSGTSAMTRLELFFGGDIGGPDGVSERDWKGFLDAEITPRFPDGFTVADAYGQWRDGRGVIKAERSKQFIVLVRDADAQAEKIAAIREAYKTRFHQESVL
jgi:hypothetical protein